MPRAHKPKKEKRKISDTVSDYDCIAAFTKGKTAQAISYSSVKRPTGTISLFTKSGDSVGDEIAKLETVNKNKILFINTNCTELDVLEKIVLNTNPIPVFNFKYDVIQREKIREVLNGKNTPRQRND